MRGKQALRHLEDVTAMRASLKMLLYLFFAASVFLMNSATPALFLAAASLLLLLLHPDKRMRRGIVPIVILVTATLAGNLFFHPGRVLMELGPLGITDESLEMAVVRAARVSALVVGAKLLTLTTPVEEILAVLKRASAPLERAGLPASEFFETASLTMKVLPEIRAEAARSYRKVLADTRGDGLIYRLGAIANLLFTLMVRTLRSPSDFVNADGGGPDGMDGTGKLKG